MISDEGALTGSIVIGQGPKGDKGESGPKGDTGIQGPKGDKGDKGDIGEKGEATKIWFSDSDPTYGEEKIGDIHINRTNWSVSYRTEDEWENVDSIKGDPGSLILTGAGIPGQFMGKDLDIFINTETGELYKKLDGAWILNGSLIGPQGPEGPEGPPGDNTAEIIQARGSYNKLGTRLDTINASLEQKATQLALEVEKARINNLVANAGDVTNNADLLDIRVGADGVNYSSAGEAVRKQIGKLTDGKIDKDGRKQIKAVNAEFIKQEYSLNLFNKNSIISGKAISANGLIIDNASYVLSDYIPIDYQKQYSIPTKEGRGFYDNNLNFISYQSYSEGLIITPPSGAYYIRVNVGINSVNTFMLVEGATYPTIYTPFSQIDKLTNVRVDYSDVINKPNAVSSELVRSTNLFDLTKATDGYSINSTTGLIVTNATYSVSDFIEVESGKMYFKGSNNVAFYDANKNLLGVENYSNAFTTIPINSKYIRISFQTSIKGSVRVVKVENSDTQPSWSAYSEYKKVDTIQNSVLHGKKIGFLGDSYTSEKNQISYPTYIKKRVGCNIFNYGESGSRVCSEGTFVLNGVTSPVESFIKRCDGMTNDLDLLMIMGGINDAGTNMTIGTINDTEAENSTFYAGYKLLLKKVVTKYPSAKLVCVCPPQVPNYTRLHNEFRQAIKDCAGLYGIPVLDLDAEFSYSNVNASLYTLDRYISNNAGTSSDVNIHLNATGRLKMSYLIERFLEKQFVYNETLV